MKSFSLLSAVIFVTFLTGCSGIQDNLTEPIIGIDTPLRIDGAQLTVLDARIRKSMQTHYLMSYPPAGKTFYVVTISIEGINADPDETLDWGVSNLILKDESDRLTPTHAQRTIANEHVAYKVGEQLTFLYIYYFEVPIESDFRQYSLSLDVHSISLGSMVQIPNAADDDGVEIDLYNVVSGGSNNQADAYHATVSGGQLNAASASHATVGGGRENSASYFYATIGGGYANVATGRDTFVGGGSRNTAGDARATIGGGIQNAASAPDTTIAGGAYNQASDDYAAVAGGTRNSAGGFSSVIGGGAGNTTTADQTTISGGLGNQATAPYSTVSGGQGNIASGAYASIPGGLLNTAGGEFSLAAGHRAQVEAEHSGVFIFADSNDFDFASRVSDEFAVRATGGVRFISGIDQEGISVTGVSLPAGSGSWATLSDRHVKENISPIDSDQILATVVNLPIAIWNYSSQDTAIQHIGPMAQDFYVSFGLGEDDKHINTVDADGVSLAAIQGMYAIVQEQEAKINQLQALIWGITIALILFIFIFITLWMMNINRQNSQLQSAHSMHLHRG